MRRRRNWIALLLAAVSLIAACSGDSPAVAPETTVAATPEITPSPVADEELSSAKKLDLVLQIFADRYAVTVGTTSAATDHAFLYLACAAASDALRDERCGDGPYGENEWAGSFVVEVMYQRSLDFDTRGGLSAGSPALQALEEAVGQAVPRCSNRMVLCDGDFVTIQQGIVYFSTRLQEHLVAAIGREIDVASREAGTTEAVVARLRTLRTEHVALLDRMSDAFAIVRDSDELSALGASVVPRVVVGSAVQLREDLILDALRGRFASSEVEAIYARSVDAGA